MVNTVMGIAIGIIMFAQYPVPLPVRNVPRDTVALGLVRIGSRWGRRVTRRGNAISIIPHFTNQEALPLFSNPV